MEELEEFEQEMQSNQEMRRRLVCIIKLLFPYGGRIASERHSYILKQTKQSNTNENLNKHD